MKGAGKNAAARLSIIVPCLNEAACIVAALTRLQPLRLRGAEVIVVDGGSEDASIELAKPGADRVLTAPRGRALQMNAGAAAARGEVLLFLHADCSLPSDADRLIRDGLAASGERWGRFDVELAGTHPLLCLIAVMMNWRSRLTGIATGDQGLFVTRKLFETAGGYPSISLMEDIELSKRLKVHGAPLCLKPRITVSVRRWKQHGVLRTLVLMWRLRLAYFCGADPADLAQRYDSSHPGTSPLVGMKSAQRGGRSREETPWQVHDHNSRCTRRGVFPAAETRILVFAKAPIAGTVKTRLIPLLGAEGAAALQRVLIERTLATALEAGLGPVELWGAPSAGDPLLAGYATRFAVTLVSQPDGDLGARMLHAAAVALKSSSSVIIIGCDCPAMTSADLQRAAAALDPQHDAVFIPAEDGGYALIALRRWDARLFSSIAWGGNQVMAVTRERLAALGWRWRELAALWDIDRPADYQRLLESGIIPGLQQALRPSQGPGSSSERFVTPPDRNPS